MDGLAGELDRFAALAARYAEEGEQVAGVLASEPRAGRRAYLCAYESRRGRTWLALDDAGRPLTSRNEVRETVAITALCELAADSAGGGDLEELRAHLVAVRLREHPPGIEEAEEAALALERTLGVPPRLATPAFLDAVGEAARRLEQALGGDGGSPFAEAMRLSFAAVDSLAAEVERNYKLELA